jgi:hypothetical protein
MNEATVTGKPDALDKLAETRSEFLEIVRPASRRGSDGSFPRSATMRALTGRGAVSTVALVGIAVLATRPSIAGRVARAMPLIGLLRQLGPGAR